MRKNHKCTQNDACQHISNTEGTADETTRPGWVGGSVTKVPVVADLLTLFTSWAKAAGQKAFVLA